MNSKSIENGKQDGEAFAYIMIHKCVFNVSKRFSILLPIFNTLTIHSCFLESKSQQK